MKKNTLFAIVALLMMSVSALAQSNSYNMVIEMANGTKINIGPNDVKNIYFNDGELVVSGENLEQLVQTSSNDIKKLQAQIADLAAALNNTQAGSASTEDVKMLVDKIAYIESKIDNLESQPGGASSDEINKLQAQIADLAVAMQNTARVTDVAALYAKVTSLDEKIDYLESQSGGVSINDIYRLQERIDYLIKTLKDHGIE